MTAAPKRRWFQWSLRTLFVVVTVFACWLGYQVNWIRQRHAFLSQQQEHWTVDGPGGSFIPFYGSASAPFPLWLFGEEGYRSLHVVVMHHMKAPDLEPKDRYPESRRAMSLFPEAVAVVPIMLPPDETSIPDGARRTYQRLHTKAGRRYRVKQTQ